MEMPSMEEMMYSMQDTQEDKAAGAEMKSDTQILLAIFEKVTCIEHMMEGKKSGGVSLPNSSIMLEGEGMYE